MKLVDAAPDRLTIELSIDDWRKLSGMFSMINAAVEPRWLDSTHDPDTALSEESYLELESRWTSLTTPEVAGVFFDRSRS